MVPICVVPNNRFANTGARLPHDVLGRVLFGTSANDRGSYSTVSIKAQEGS